MQEKKPHNPWLEIPPDDYENHMASPEVEQLQALNVLFKDVLKKYRPGSIAVIGCTTGNGFEHIDPRITKRVLGIDINQHYLDIARERHAHFPGMEFMCADIASAAADEIRCDPVELIHAALLFEYVSIEEALPRIVRLMMPGGILSVGLQLKSPNSEPVTKTRYTSLEKLSPIMNLVNPEEFTSTAEKCGLRLIDSSIIDLKKGKRLFAGYYRKEA